MNLARYVDTPFQEEHVVAAVVARTEAGNLHAGLLYWDGMKVAELHLGWVDRMFNTWDWSGVWASPSGGPEQLNAAAGMCRLVWRRFNQNRRFPYGLHFDGASFDASGRLELGPNSRGLTCATLILAVMRFARIRVVAEETWPTRTDEDLKFIEFVRPWAKEEHVAALERDVDEGAKRIWPDEVVGACSLAALPADFDRARNAADRVLELLRGES